MKCLYIDRWMAYHSLDTVCCMGYTPCDIRLFGIMVISHNKQGKMFETCGKSFHNGACFDRLD